MNAEAQRRRNKQVLCLIDSMFNYFACKNKGIVTLSMLLVTIYQCFESPDPSSQV